MQIYKDRSIYFDKLNTNGTEYFKSVRPEPVEGNEQQRIHMRTQKLLIYSLSLIIINQTLGMQINKIPLGMKKKFVRTAINKSKELDTMRQTWSPKDSPQDVVGISKGKITIKERIAQGKRYGTCHNYAFTSLMGIVGKAPSLLNIMGQKDYYADAYINSSEFFELRKPDAPMHQGDLVVYFSKDEKGSFDDITHAGIVVGDDCIESKWGSIPAVFEHPVWYVPTSFGNHCFYYKLKVSGPDLLAEVQKRSQQKWVKKRYDVLARYAQQGFVDSIKEYGKHIYPLEIDRLRDILLKLEYRMDIHLNKPDEHGITPLMHAEKIGCEHLKSLFAAYDKYNE
jgi:hypothetical protein